MRYESTTEHWQTGMHRGLCSHFKLTGLYRLLQAPFDFSQAFSEALKKIIDALPNRPAKESSEDAVR